MCFVSFMFKLQLFTKQFPIKILSCISIIAPLLSPDWKRDGVLLRYVNHLWNVSILFFSVSEQGFFLVVRTNRKSVLRKDSIYDYRIIYFVMQSGYFSKKKYQPEVDSFFSGTWAIIKHEIIMNNDKMLQNK